MEGLILAGGASRRYGADKAFAIWEGKTFLRRVADALEPNCDELWILGRPDVPSQRYHELVPLARVRVDVQAQAGPLAAIREALKQGRSDFVVVAPCDAPALTADSIGKLILAARQAKKAAVAVSGGSTLFDLFCSPRNPLEERLKTAKRLEDLVVDAVEVPFDQITGLNVNEPV